MTQAEATARKDGTFDFYTWPAPFFKTPKEVFSYLSGLRLKGKTIAGIYGIGYVRDAGQSDSSQLYQRIRGAGIPLRDDWYTSYPYLDRVLVPQEVTLCEPTQFVFTDGSTLEFLPVEGGGARIGVNSLPRGLVQGLNHSNFDICSFFAEVRGRTAGYVSMRITETAREFSSSGKPEESLFTQRRPCYQIELPLDSVTAVTLAWEWSNWYQLSITGDWRRGMEGKASGFVPYHRVKQAKKNVDQILIVNGRGGDFWICPTNLNGKGKWDARQYGGYGISILEDDVAEFLSEFLLHYYDAAAQKREVFDEKGFDWHGDNIYTFPAVQNMLADIRRASRLLRLDYDHTSLDQIKQRFMWYPYTELNASDLSEKDKNELRKRRVPLAVDFYQRFCNRLERMMTLPGRNAIVFSGPGEAVRP